MSGNWAGWWRSAPCPVDTLGPMHDQRRGDAALVDPMFVLAEGRVGDVGPGNAVALVGDVLARHHSRVVAVLDGTSIVGEIVAVLPRQPLLPLSRDLLGAAAVVGQEEDQRVLPLVGLAQRVEDATDALVHAVDLRGVDLHAPHLPLFVLGVLPGRL